MKSLLPFFLAATLCAPTYVRADDEVTPLQLKVMQTRKFMKPSLEVSKAAVEDGESLGALKCINPVAMYQRIPNGKAPRGGEVDCRFAPKISMFSHGTDGITRLVYDISSNQDDTESTVRMKIFVNWKDPKQITDPETYAKRFKNMGDLIFIDAIPLNPVVQN